MMYGGPRRDVSANKPPQRGCDSSRRAAPPWNGRLRTPFPRLVAQRGGAPSLFVLAALALSPVAHAQPSGASVTSIYPEPMERVDHGSWVRECYGERRRRCQLYHRVVMNRGTRVALVATMAYPPNERTMDLQIAVPLGIDLEAGATLAVGADYTTPAPIKRCTQQGCLIEGVVTPGLLGRFLAAERDGLNATITVREVDGGPFAIPVMLNGFTEAHAALAPANAEPPVLPAPVRVVEPDPATDGDAADDEPVDGAQAPGEADAPDVSDGTVTITPAEPAPDTTLAPVTGNTQGGEQSLEQVAPVVEGTDGN